MRDPPVDDADEFGTPALAGGEAHLSAGLIGRLEQHDVVTALGGDPRRFEPGRAGADHDDLLLRALGRGR